MAPGDDRLVRALAGTMATRFASVYRWRAGEFNEMVAGFRRHVSAAALRGKLLAAPAELAPVARAAAALRPVAPSSDPLTDDRAPVEWLTDQMIIRYAVDGSG
jgi:hypothetical protein